MANFQITPYKISDIPPVMNRMNWAVEINQSVLLIHDMQNYYLTPVQQHSPDMFRLILKNIQQLIQKFRQQNLPIIYTYYDPVESAKQRGLILQLWGNGLPTFPEEARQIADQIAPTKNDIILTKYKYSAFFHTDLAQILSSLKKNQLIITGVFAHVGYYATAVDAFINDFKAFLVADAVADLSAELHAATLTLAASSCAQVIYTDQI